MAIPRDDSIPPAYLKFADELVICADIEWDKLWEAHRHLIDDRLVRVLTQMADVLADKGTSAPLTQEKWARVQQGLAVAYLSIPGDREENLRRAATYCKRALQVFTMEAFPLRWAALQCTLGRVYRSRQAGDRAKNLEMAIHYFEQALKVRMLTEVGQQAAARIPPPRPESETIPPPQSISTGAAG